jgi:two-component system chemotaxis response regulator CheY
MAKIMVADDSAFMRLIIKEIVSKSSHQVIAEAEDGSIAVKKYSELRPDLVIMNIIMPELYGIEALRRIKKMDPNAKVIMCSAMGNQYQVIEAIQAGALDFIVKPFDSARMVDAINRAVSKML